jgi:hypothetical protein
VPTEAFAVVSLCYRALPCAREQGHQDSRRAVDARDRCNVVDEIEFKVVVKCRVPRVNRRELEERVAGWRRTHDSFGADVATCAGPVNDEWLTEVFRQPLTD